MSDDLQLRLLFDASTIGDPKDKLAQYGEVFERKIPDQNGQNYSGPIIWDTTTWAVNSLIDYHNAYLLLPITVANDANTKDSAGAEAGLVVWDQNTMVALRQSVYDAVGGLNIQVNGTEIVNEPQGERFLINNKLVVEHSNDWAFSMGAELHFAKSGVDQCATDGYFPTACIERNPQFWERCEILRTEVSNSQKATFANTRSFNLKLPLMYLHSFFERANFIMPNTPIRLQLTPSWMTGVNYNKSTFMVQQNALTAMTSATMPQRFTVSITSNGPCYLVAKHVKLNARENSLLGEKLAHGLPKHINYSTYQYVEIKTGTDLILGAQANYDTQVTTRTLTNSVTNAKRLWIFPMMAGCLVERGAAAGNLADSILLPSRFGNVMNGVFENFQILINNEPFFETPLNTFDQWKQLESQFPNEAFKHAPGSLLNYKDYTIRCASGAPGNAAGSGFIYPSGSSSALVNPYYHPICVDISRRTDLFPANAPIQIQIQTARVITAGFNAAAAGIVPGGLALPANAGGTDHTAGPLVGDIYLLCYIEREVGVSLAFGSNAVAVRVL